MGVRQPSRGLVVDHLHGAIRRSQPEAHPPEWPFAMRERRCNSARPPFGSHWLQIIAPKLVLGSSLSAPIASGYPNTSHPTRSGNGKSCSSGMGKCFRLSVRSCAPLLRINLGEVYRATGKHVPSLQKPVEEFGAAKPPGEVIEMTEESRRMTQPSGSMVLADGIFESFIRFGTYFFDIRLTTLGQFRVMVWVPSA